MKCDTCKIQEDINKSEEPACCVWFMENVVCGNKTPEDCTWYKKRK